MLATCKVFSFFHRPLSVATSHYVFSTFLDCNRLFINVFKFVLFVTTVCFLDDINKAFREAYRVLKKGGRLIAGLIDFIKNLSLGGTAWCAYASEPISAFGYNGRHAGQGFDVVDHRGSAKQTAGRRIRRAVPWHAAKALHGTHNMLQARIAAQQKITHQHFDLAGIDFVVEQGRETRIRMINNHHRFGVAVADIAHCTDAGLKVTPGKSLGKGLPGLYGSGGNAAGGRANGDLNTATGSLFPAAPLGVGLQSLPHAQRRILAIGIHSAVVLFPLFPFQFEYAG